VQNEKSVANKSVTATKLTQYRYAKGSSLLRLAIGRKQQAWKYSPFTSCH